LGLGVDEDEGSVVEVDGTDPMSPYESSR